MFDLMSILHFSTKVAVKNLRGESLMDIFPLPTPAHLHESNPQNASSQTSLGAIMMMKQQLI